MPGIQKESVVRIDAELLKRVETFISRKDNNLKYANKKQFIDIAVFEKLKKEAKS